MLRQLRGAVVWRRLVVTGILLAEFQVAYQISVERISVSLATLITIGCVPVFVAGVTAVRDRRLPSRQVLAALAASLVGLGLLCGAPDVGGDTVRTVVGVVTALAAGAGFAALTLVAARPVAAQGATVSVGLLLGGLLLTPFALGYGMVPVLTVDTVALIGYLGIVPTALAYGAYFLGLRRAGATAAALSTMLEPLTATVLAVLFHGERMTVAGVVGAVLIGGSLIATGRTT